MEPGWTEADTVSHSGPSACGTFVYTVNQTDLFSQWTESQAVLGKGAGGVVEALDEMRQATVIAQRPWLGIDGNATLEKADHRWVARFRIKNYGLSPALHSVFAGETANAPLTAEVAKLKIEQACFRGEKLTGTELYLNSAEGHGYAIFPGAPPQTENITIGGGPAPETAVSLLGCMTYLDQFGALHHTRFCQGVGPPMAQGTEFRPCFGGQTAD